MFNRKEYERKGCIKNILSLEGKRLGKDDKDFKGEKKDCSKREVKFLIRLHKYDPNNHNRIFSKLQKDRQKR